MLVSFGDEALEFQDLVREILSKECSVERLRTDFESASSSRERWATLAQVGLFAATVPEEFGGLGLDDATMALIAEEVGFAALPEPVIETVCVVTPLMTRYGTSEDKQKWLPAIAAGEVMATVQMRDMPAAIFGELADVAIIEGDDGLVVAELGGTERARRSVAGPRKVVGDADGTGSPLTDGAASRAEARARGAASAAAVLNGVSRRLLDMSIEYALSREQFGVPIGSFQAVKHMLAEVYAALESARPAAWHAARALARGDRDSHIASSVAKVAANRAGKLASWHALQVHGGIGFTWEHHLHIWMKRAKSLEAQWGSTREHRRLLGAAAMQSGDLVRAFGPA